MSQHDFIVIGHRGACNYKPENTIPSIEYAIQLGAPWTEIDVQIVENNLVVIHDTRLERTTNGCGRVAEQTFSYVRSLDAGQGAVIPTLQEVLNTVKDRIGLNIELKASGTAELVGSLLNEQFKAGLLSTSQILVSSFDFFELKKLKEIVPAAQVAPLFYGLQPNMIELAKWLNAYSINVSCDFLSVNFLEEAHSAGYKVFAYTIAYPEDGVRMKNMGVDGVFSGCPDKIIKATQN